MPTNHTIHTIQAHPSYIQIEYPVYRGTTVIRIYDRGEHPRFMSYMWDSFERMEVPVAVTLSDLHKAQALAIEERKKKV